MNVRHGIVWLTLFCVWNAVGLLSAQTPLPPKSEAAAGSGADKPAVAKPAASDVIPLKNANGEVVPLLRTPLLEEVLAELMARRQRLAPEPTQWSVAGISLQGTADGDHAILQTTLQIQLLVDAKWIKVPLRLTEATLQDHAYTGPGEATSGGIDPDQGYLWYFKGKGLHVLKLNLIVPIRKELPARRLQLTLPPTVVSELKLRVPVPRLTAKVDEQSRARLILTPTPDGATTIDMLGLGGRLDVTWQPQPDLGTVETVLEARTAITATVDGRAVLMEANQRLGALQGSFNQVQVRLPRGGELLKVEGDLYKEHSLDAQDPSLVLVTLKEAASSAVPVDLKWTVRVEIPAKSERVLLEGFEVSKAKIQTGHLALRLVGDYRLERIDNQNQFVQRDNLSTLEKALPPFPSREDVSSAYSILRQPFQLAFNLQPEKPHITVKPRLFLTVNADRMELFGEYDVQVYRWGIEEVKFAWPGWKDEGWKLDPIAPPNQVEETRLDDPAEILVKLIERKVGPVVRVNDRASATEPKQFTLLLHATRPLAAGQAAQEFTLPGMPGANVMPADFVMVLADNLEADLRPVGDTVSSLQTVSQTNLVPLPANLVELRRRDFRLNAARAKFSIATTLQPRRIGTQTDVELSLEGNELRLLQRISYDVAYERLPQVLLLVPEKLEGRVTFNLAVDGQPTNLVPITPIDTGGGEGTRKQKRLALEAPRIGKFDVIIQGTLPVSWPMGVATSTTEVPLVQSSDAEYTSTRVRVLKPKRQRLTITGEGWTPQAPQSGVSVWLATAKQSVVNLQIEQSDGAWQQGVAAPRCLIQAVFSPSGEVYCQAQYQLTGQPTGLRITFPPGSKPGRIRWGEAPLEEINILQTAGSPEQYQLTLPDGETGDSEKLLTIAYQLPRQSALGVGAERHLAVPEIMSDGTQTQTFWQIQLPENQHLWTLPAGFTPEFDWQRVGGWWSRVPRQSPEDLEKWVSGSATGPRGVSTALLVGGNRYLFSSLEGSSVMSFRTLSTPLIILIGASLALVFGFVLVNVPATRHVLTFLWIGFLTTLITLWYSEPVLVLLQPAGLGLVLALLASVAQRWFKKSRIQPILTLASPSEQLVATSSREEPIPAGLTSDEVTQSHPAAYPVTEAGIGM
jgi:hypothetical protein